MTPLRPPDVDRMDLTDQERRSRTQSEFWIAEGPRELYQRALRTLNVAGVPYVVSGAFAIYHYTGIYRETKDLDLLLEPRHVVPAAKALKQAGFRMTLEQPHWIAKAKSDPHFVDLIFGIANGLAFIDEDWHRHSRAATLAGEPIRVSPPEEMIWHRLFISERHRYDLGDTVHLILSSDGQLDWDRLLRKAGEHWPLLLTHLILFRYVYPEFADYVPDALMQELLQRQVADLGRQGSRELVTRGPLISLFSFRIDVKEWGFRDLRQAAVARALQNPVVQSIVRSPVWEKEQAEGDGHPA